MQPSRSRTDLTFETPLEREDEVLDMLLALLGRGQLDAEVFGRLHAAATRDDKLGDLAMAYDRAVQGRRIRTLAAAAQAEFLYRAGTFFADELGDAQGASGYLERAVQTSPLHGPAFERLVDVLENLDEGARLADACVAVLPHRPREEQPDLLRRALALLDRKGGDTSERSLDLLQQLLRLEPEDAEAREALEGRLEHAGKHRDLTRLLEQSLAGEPEPSAEEQARLRRRLVELYVANLQELERSIPHVEALLELDPADDVAQTVARRLLEPRATAARAASALARASERLGHEADTATFLALELEHSRGARRKDVLKKIGVLRQDRLGDPTGAREVYEQALQLDPADDELRQRYTSLAILLDAPLDAARLLARVSALAKDPVVRVRIAAETGDLLRAGGDAKRARQTYVSVLAASGGDAHATYVAARGLQPFYEAEGDLRGLADVLERVGELSPHDDERRDANERLVELCRGPLDAPARAVEALRRLVTTSGRAKALEELEPLYEARGEWTELAYVLEERARDLGTSDDGRRLSFRAAEILTTRTPDRASATEAWRRHVEAYGPSHDASAHLVPLIEATGSAEDLAAALEQAANVAPRDERAPLEAKLGALLVTKKLDPSAGVGWLRRALASDAREATARALLERLLVGSEHGLEAARVLEPVLRQEGDEAALARALEVRAQLADTPEERLGALREASELVAERAPDRAFGLAIRGALESSEPSGWLDRVEHLAGAVRPPQALAALERALGTSAAAGPALGRLARLAGDVARAGDALPQARAFYLRALEADPASEELFERLDDLFASSGTPAERVDLHERTLAVDLPAPRRADLLRRMASLRGEALGDERGAAEALEALLEQTPDDAAALREAVALRERLGDADGTFRLLERSLDALRGADRVWADATLARAAARTGRGDEAKERIAAALGSQELGVTELEALAEAARSVADAALLRRTLERHLALVAEPADRLPVLEALAAVLEREPERRDAAVRALLDAARCADGLGDDARALRTLRRARVLDPEHVETATLLVDRLGALGEWQEVPELLGVLLSKAEDPSEKVRLLVRRSRVLADHGGDSAAAWSSAALAFRLAPGSAEALAHFAELSLREGLGKDFALAVDDALTEASRRDEVDPGLESTLVLEKARVLAATPGGEDEAAQSFRTLLEGGADRTTATRAEAELRALVDRDRERVDDRRFLYRRAAGLAEGDDRLRAILAWARAEEEDHGDAERALALYRDALELDPDDMTALGATARLALAAGDVSGALAALEARRRRAEGAARDAVDLQVATIRLELGHVDPATDVLAEVLARNPDAPASFELAERLLEHRRVAERVVDLLEAAHERSEDPDARGARLRLLMSDRVREALPDAARLKWHARLVGALERDGRLDEALIAAIRAAEELATEPSTWDQAEELARRAGTPAPLAEAYARLLAAPPSRELAAELGQRAVAFHEEWFDDVEGTVRLLERMLALDPDDTWAFDRLKLLFDANERWDDLFALFDRAIARAHERDRRIELLEDAAQIAKDFARHGALAIKYLEQLHELLPKNARIAAALERLYEKHGANRELIGLLVRQLPGMGEVAAQETRARIAGLWLDALHDPAAALRVLEDVLAHEDEVPLARVDATALLERVLEEAPQGTSMRESLLPPGPAGPPRELAEVRLVRQRAAGVLRERFVRGGRDADVARMLEIALEPERPAAEAAELRRELVATYERLGEPRRALAHAVELVLLDPSEPTHRSLLAELSDRTHEHRLRADVLERAAARASGDVRVDLLLEAARLEVDALGDAEQAITLYGRVLDTPGLDEARDLAACRAIDPLLAARGDSARLLEVLERRAPLEGEDDARADVLRRAGRLAADLAEHGRAVRAFTALVRLVPGDPEAHDRLVEAHELRGDAEAHVRALLARAALDRSAQARRQDRVLAARLLAGTLGRTADAIDVWRETESTLGDTAEGTRELSELYRLEGRFGDLADLLDRAATRAPEGEEKGELLRALGDLRRGALDDPRGALDAYGAALATDPGSEGARAGARGLLAVPSCRREATLAMLAAFRATDDWKVVVELTEHRVATAPDEDEIVLVLLEASDLCEQRGGDTVLAFDFARRALQLAPEDQGLEDRLADLAGRSGRHRDLADALRAVLGHLDAKPDAAARTRARGTRVRLGDVLERELRELHGALEHFETAARDVPDDVAVAVATARVAGRIAAWERATEALRRTSLARGAFTPEVSAALLEVAGESGAWDDLVRALAVDAHVSAETSKAVARDLEELVAKVHRDRRGDAGAAERALERALELDPAHPELLRQLSEVRRRSKGRPLVDSLLRLSDATGGDLDLLAEAAQVSEEAALDRKLTRSILDRLAGLAEERWLGADAGRAVSSGAPGTPEGYVLAAMRATVRLCLDGHDPAGAVDALVAAAQLPFPRGQARELRHEAAALAERELRDEDRAIGLLSGLLDEDPRDELAAERLVKLYGATGRSRDLLALRRRLVEVAARPDERATRRLEVASLQETLGEPEAAVATLESTLAELPRDEATVQALERLLTRERRFAELETLYVTQADLAEGGGERGRATAFLARATDVAQRELGVLARARAHAERRVALEPSAEALSLLADLAKDLGDPLAAAASLERLHAVETPERRPEVSLRWAGALVAGDEPARARAVLEAESQASPAHAAVADALAERLAAEGDDAALARHHAFRADHAANDAEAIQWLVRAATLEAGPCAAPDRAVTLLERAATLAPEDRDVLFRLAEALSACERLDEARTVLGRVLDTFGARRPKERAPVHYHLARLELRSGNRDRALAELDAAGRIDPQSVEILHLQAELAKEEGQHERAERAYRALATVLRRREPEPGDAVTRTDVLVELATLAERADDEERAAELLESAFEIAAENAVEALHLEAALRRRADHARLVRALERRLSRAPAADAWSELSILLAGPLAQPEEALRARFAALELDPFDGPSHDEAARLAAELGAQERYATLLRELTARADQAAAPGASELHQRLARRLLAAGDLAGAARALERSRAFGAVDRTVLLDLEALYEQLGDPAGRLDALSARVELEGDGASPESLYRLAELELAADAGPGSSDADDDVPPSAPPSSAARGRRGELDAARTRGREALERALAREADLGRALGMLERVTQPDAQLVALYERLAREADDTTRLADALGQRWEATGDRAAIAEAAELTERAGGDEALEALLRRWLEREEDAAVRTATLERLARLRERAGDAAEAVLLTREASEGAGDEDAIRLLVAAGRLAEETLRDDHLVVSVHAEIYERFPSERAGWEPLLRAYRRLDDSERLSALLDDIASRLDDPAARARLRFEQVRLGLDRLGTSEDDAIVELGSILEEDRQLEDAADLLRELLARAGRDEDVTSLVAARLDAARDRQDGPSVARLALELGGRLEREDVARARDVYAGAIEWAPEELTLFDALARAAEQAGDASAAADALERSLPLRSDADAARTVLRLADHRAAVDERGACVAPLEAVWERTHAGAVADRLETVLEAEGELRKLAQLHRARAEAAESDDEKVRRLRLAAALLRDALGDPEIASHVLRQARALRPGDDVLLDELVATLHASGDVPTLLRELDQVIAERPVTDPIRGVFLGRRAQLRARQGDDDGALADFHAALDAGQLELRGALAEHLEDALARATRRGDAEADRRFGLALAALEESRGDADRARDVLRDLAVRHKRDRDVLRALAEHELRSGRASEAVDVLLDLALAEDSALVVPTALRAAEAAEAAGRPTDARPALERAREHDPADPRVVAALETVYEAAGANRELAELLVATADAQRDKNQKVARLVRAGKVLLDDPETAPLALEPLQAAHATKPQDAEAVSLLSAALLAGGRLVEAREVLEESLAAFKGRRTREVSILNAALARIAERTGDRRGMLEHLVLALEADAQSSDVASWLAELALELEEWEIAQRALRAVTVAKGSPPMPRARAFFHLGEIAERQGDVRRAVQYLRRALEEDPELEPARALLSEIGG